MYVNTSFLNGRFGSMNATLTAFGETTKVSIRKDKYANNQATALIASNAKTGEPYCTLSVNLVPYSNSIPKNQCFIKTWSENEGMLEQLVDQHIVSLTKVIDSGTGARLVTILF
jgi:hypothetical protein